MKRDELIDAIGGIGKDILEESQQLRQNRRSRASLWSAAAAVAIFFLAASVMIFVIRNNAASKQPESADRTISEKTEIITEDEDPETDPSAADGQDPEAKVQPDTADESDISEESDHYDENDPQALIIRLTPDAYKTDRYMLYADDRYQVCRVGSELGGPQSFIMLKNISGIWEVASHITSEKTSMSDRVEELKAAARDFWQYYKTVFPVAEDWIRKAEEYIREHYIAVEYDPSKADPEETFSEDERRTLRGHVNISYAAEMTEEFVPDFMAWAFGTCSHDYLRFVQPVFVMKMVCPESEDPALNRLISKDIGDIREEYYCMSGFVTWEGETAENLFRVTVGVQNFFDEINTGGQWLIAADDAVKSEEWDMSLMVHLYNCTEEPRTEEQYRANKAGVFRCEEEKIEAAIDVLNNMEGYTSCTLLVLADGAPAQFTIDGEEYEYYRMYISGCQRLRVEIDPVFDLHIGHLSFYIVNNEILQQNRAYYSDYTCVIKQDEEPVMPEKLHETVKARNTLYSSVRGAMANAWVWDGDFEITEEIANGVPGRIFYHPGDDLILEAIGGEPGYYRTVLITGGHYADVTENGQKFSCIDWQQTDGQMLQLRFRLNEMEQEEEILTKITTNLTRGDETWGTYDFFSTKLIYSED